MIRKSKGVLLGAVTMLVLEGCAAGYSEEVPEQQLRVRRGAFTSDVALSGELEAARGETLAVPPLPNWETSIRWLADDGILVKAGDPVVELDNSALTSDLETKRQTSTQAAQELQQRESEWAADLGDKELEVEKKKSDLDKALLESNVPKELISSRSFEEKQGALRRAASEHEKAVDSLRARRVAINAERENLLLNIESTRRDILRAEEAIHALVLRAPRAGTVVIRDHPWEGRKLQTGDRVWVGFPIATMPELDSMRVAAALADVDDGRIANGMPATVTIDGYPDLQFSGRIASISAVAQESRRMSLRRNFSVLVTLDRVDTNRMRPGLSARVTVRRDAQSAVLLAPRAAIDFSGSSPRVKSAGGELKDVKLGACNAQECIVTSGLEEGARLASVVEVRRG